MIAIKLEVRSDESGSADVILWKARLDSHEYAALNKRADCFSALHWRVPDCGAT